MKKIHKGKILIKTFRNGNENAHIALGAECFINNWNDVCDITVGYPGKDIALAFWGQLPSQRTRHIGIWYSQAKISVDPTWNEEYFQLLKPPPTFDNILHGFAHFLAIVYDSSASWPILFVLTEKRIASPYNPLRRWTVQF